MINFFHSGSIVGVDLPNANLYITWSLLMFLSVEFSCIVITRIELFHKIYIYFRVKSQIKKIIPNWWRLDSVSFVTIDKLDKKIGAHIKVSSKVGKSFKMPVTGENSNLS